MKRFLLLLALGLAVGLPCRADNDSPRPAVPGVPAAKWSLQVLHPRIAAGGFADETHHSEFVVRGLDARGNPLVGVPVELPHIWDDKGDTSDRTPEYPHIARPRVEWPSQTKTILTDAKGEARGRFTSGGTLEQIVLHGPGDSEAKIEQVWNDEPKPFQEQQTSFATGQPCEWKFVFTVKRGDKMVPVTGHHLKHLLNRVTLRAYRRTGLFDENGQPQVEDETFDWKMERPPTEANPAEKARWEIVSRWFDFTSMKEVTPGVYQGEGTALELGNGGETPARPLLDGFEIDSVASFGAYVQDSDVFLP